MSETESINLCQAGLSVEINIYMNEWQEAGKQAARKKNEK
jgi:hypothetical protein